MIDLRQAILDQQDVPALCATRPTTTSEAYWPNDNYGFASVVKAYAGYPGERSLPALIPHGVYLDEDALHDSEANAPYPAVLSYPKYRDRPFKRYSSKLVIPSASPFLYALKLVGSLEPPERSGTIYFPSHSTAAYPTKLDWQGLARSLDDIPNEFKPLTVCVHWHDLQLGRAVPFLERGYRVVSAGHLADPEFLFRLIHLMSVHRHAASNDVGSNLMYAVSMGLPYFLHGKAPQRSFKKGKQPETSAIRRKREIAKLFSKPRHELTAEQQECAAYHLRAEVMRSPDDLAADLFAAAERY